MFEKYDSSNGQANKKSIDFTKTDFLENENLFQKIGVPFFSWKH